MKDKHPGVPHAFFCSVCGCSLYTHPEINARECEPCMGWLMRIVRRHLTRTRKF
jgi:hypothetical protein